MRKLAPLFAAAALAAAGCGGGGSREHAAATGTGATPSPPTSPAAPTETSTSTTAKPAPPRTQRAPATKGNELKVTAVYKCNGRRLRGLSSIGPVSVKPKFVKPGQSFAVIITDPSARVADVSLTGVSTQPIMASAKPVGGRLTATLRVPPGASCGNKLVTVEGDVSAQAYVGVGS